MKPRVIDLSHHNTVDTLVDAKNEGVIGVIHKMSEGTSMVDDKADNRKFLADEAGMKFGLYHFFHGNANEAQFFFNKAQGIADANTLWACDFEVSGVHLSAVAGFMEELAQLTGKAPVLYSGSYLKDAISRGEKPDALIQYRLWMPQYGPTAKLPHGWDKYWIWQYSDQGKVSGVHPQCDVNWFEGADEDLEW